MNRFRWKIRRAATLLAIVVLFMQGLRLLGMGFPSAWGDDVADKDAPGKEERPAILAPVVNDPAVVPKAKFTKPVLIRFEGVVTPLTEHYLFRKLEIARKQQADLVVIEIDSPGGMLEASLAIAEKLRDVSWARTVAFVPREALSGAAIAALGCDEIVMHPHAKIGDAGPIYRDEAGMFQHAPEKIRSHLARHVRDLAEAKQRAPALAEAMVDKDLVVFRVRDKEKNMETYLSEAELRAEEMPDRWEKIAPLQEAGAGNFFEVNGMRAEELNFAQGIAKDRNALKERYGLTTEWTVMKPGDLETIVFLLNLPLITGLLIVIGLVGVYFEFSAPGTCIGGLVATLCFTLFFWSRFLGGTSGWLEVMLFLAGAVFFAMEIFVLPGFGVAGFAGLALMAASLIMASQDFVLPETTSQLNTLGTTLTVIACSSVAFVIIAVFISRHFKSIPMFNRLVLTPPTNEASNSNPEEDRSQLSPFFPTQVAVGDQGVAESSLRPAGKASFGDHFVDVVADGTFVDKGTEVQVVRIQGNRVIVRELRAKRA